MDVVVFGKHVEVDAALRAVTLEKVERIGKFASDVRRSRRRLRHHQTRRAGDSRTCEILVHLTHHLVKGTAVGRRARDGARPRAREGRAPDAAAARAPRAARRNRHARAHGTASQRRAADRLIDADGDFGGSTTTTSTDGPDRIVKTKQFAVKPMHAEEAALQMELLGHDFFLFRNVESDNAAGAVPPARRRPRPHRSHGLTGAGCGASTVGRRPSRRRSASWSSTTTRCSGTACCRCSGEPDLVVVGEARDGMEAIEQAAELQPDVVFMDVRMPSVNGIEAAPPDPDRAARACGS